MITTDNISDGSMRQAIAYTYAMIEMIDDGIGRILSSLDSRGLTDNTIILFTSDHGELLGTHGLLHKGPPPYRQLTEVSLLLKGPGITAGRTIDTLTSHIDLAPTFLELAGIELDGNEFDGVSLKPLLNGKGGIYREYDLGEYHPTTRPEIYNQTIRTEHWRLTIYPCNPEWGELFDLDSDPEEHLNLYHTSSVNSVRKELENILAT